MDLSVVIPTYNQAALLSKCLDALLQQTLSLASFEIIVVNDGSRDDTAQVIRRYERDRPAVRAIHFASNRGRSAARNAGITAATGELIVFMDSDVLVGSDFLAIHLRAHRDIGPGILSRGPVVNIPSPELAGRIQPPRFGASPAYLDTANAGIRRTVLVEAALLFDEGFPGYGWEDFELGQRLKHVGIRRLFCWQAVAWHVQPPLPLDRLPDLLRRESERAKSAAYFLRKSPTLETRWLIQWTAMHRVLYWLTSAAGSWRLERAAGLAERLRRAGLSQGAYLLLRAELNQYYIECLARELHGNAVLA